jgi:DNA-directed RNA polymerase specialized sigma24 family protein
MTHWSAHELLARVREIYTDPSTLDLLIHSDRTLSERTAIVRSIIEGLPVELRVVFDAVFCERLSKRETARRLGLHRLEVDRRLSRIADAVRDSIEIEP